jgi:hygromycin-B 7''-O-kinase
MDEARPVLLHGDLTHLNMFVEPYSADWHITGLIDWGDARLGPPGHEFISPGVHMYLGDRTALSAFHLGCGKAMAGIHDNKELMARAMLYYGGDFAAFLRINQELNDCRDWGCVAQQMW